MSTLELKRESFASALGVLEGRELLEDEPLCINVRGRAAHCDRCIQACHSGALSVSPDALDVDRGKCTGCGGCVPACPAGALRLSGFSPKRFLDALEGMVEVHLHCTESREGCGGVVIPCFKILDERLLSVARTKGVQRVCLHGLDRCAGCRQGGALRQVARMRRRLKQQLGDSAPKLVPVVAGIEANVETRVRQDQPHFDRRTFLRLAGTHMAEEAARWLVPVEQDDDQNLPFYQGDPEELRRSHPYHSLMANHVSEVPWRADVPLPWHLRTLADHCTACLACGRRCPTGALCAQQEAHSCSISFEPALCTDCGLCEAICPVDAIQTHSTRRVAEVVAGRQVLMMRRLQKCENCGAGFLPDDGATTICPVCSNEQELDDQWLAMLDG